MLADAVAEAKKYTVQVQQCGQITVPQQFRDALSIREGDMLTLMQIGDVMLLTPKALRSSEIADQIADLMDEKGVTLNDLLENLPDIRKEIYNERYGRT